MYNILTRAQQYVYPLYTTFTLSKMLCTMIQRFAQYVYARYDTFTLSNELVYSAGSVCKPKPETPDPRSSTLSS